MLMMPFKEENQYKGKDKKMCEGGRGGELQYSMKCPKSLYLQNDTWRWGSEPRGQPMAEKSRKREEEKGILGGSMTSRFVT